MHSEEEYKVLEDDLERQSTIIDGFSDELVSLVEEVERLKKQVEWLSRNLVMWSCKYASWQDWQDASREATMPE